MALAEPRHRVESRTPGFFLRPAAAGEREARTGSSVCSDTVRIERGRRMKGKGGVIVVVVASVLCVRMFVHLRPRSGSGLPTFAFTDPRTKRRTEEIPEKPLAFSRSSGR